MLVSDRSYGVFWDNYSTSGFLGNDSSNTKYGYVSEAGEMVDCSLLYGSKLTASYGSVPYRHRARSTVWQVGAYGSSTEGQDQTELLNVKNGYRNNNIPLDPIVQIWDY